MSIDAALQAEVIDQIRKNPNIGEIFHHSREFVNQTTQIPGFPIILAHVGDSIFSSISRKKSSNKFFIDVINAVPLGVDLSRVVWKFLNAVVERCMERVNSETQLKCQLGLDVIQAVIAGNDVSFFKDDINDMYCDAEAVYSEVRRTCRKNPEIISAAAAVMATYAAAYAATHSSFDDARYVTTFASFVANPLYRGSMICIDAAENAWQVETFICLLQEEKEYA